MSKFGAWGGGHGPTRGWEGGPGWSAGEVEAPRRKLPDVGPTGRDLGLSPRRFWGAPGALWAPGMGPRRKSPDLRPWGKAGAGGPAEAGPWRPGPWRPGPWRGGSVAQHEVLGCPRGRMRPLVSTSGLHNPWDMDSRIPGGGRGPCQGSSPATVWVEFLTSECEFDELRRPDDGTFPAACYPEGQSLGVGVQSSVVAPTRCVTLGNPFSETWSCQGRPVHEGFEAPCSHIAGLARTV